MAKSYIKLYLVTLNIYLILLTVAGIQAQQQHQQLPISNRQAGLTPGADDEYLVGFGIADITGPSADINLVSVISQLFEFTSELLSSLSQPSSYEPSFSPGRFSSVARVGQPTPAPPPPPLAFSESHQDVKSSVLSSANQSADLVSHLPTTSSRPRKPKPTTMRPTGRRSTTTRAIPHRTNHQTERLISNEIFNGLPRVGLLSKGAKGTTTNRLTTKGMGFRLSDVFLSQAEHRQATISLNDRPLMSLSYPSWRDLQDMKLQFKVNLNNFLTNIPPMSPRSSPISKRQQQQQQTQTPQTNNLIETIIRWAMPNQIKMQVEYTYANFVVRL